MKVLQSYKYGSSSEFTFNVDELASGVSLASKKSGIGGLDFMPATGDTVTVYSNVIGTPNQLNFKPTLNNKVYYLVSNDLINDRETLLSQATALTMTLFFGRYQGSFVFSNPNDFQYLYLISDYTNNIPVGSIATHTFVNSTKEVIDCPISEERGVVYVDYSPSTFPFRIAIEYNGSIVSDSGVRKSTSPGTLSFRKTTEGKESMRVIVHNQGSPNSIAIENTGVSLTLFYMLDGGVDLGSVCGELATGFYYHDGSGSLPVAGDTIYLSDDGSILFEGTNSYHVISTSPMVSPSPTASYVAVDTFGKVLLVGSCACSEVAAPSITQTDIEVFQGQEFSILVAATNNPSSWSIVTTCNEYLLDGGEKGAIYTYTDCDSTAKRVTVGFGRQLTICANASPTLVSGTGTSTLVGPCQTGLLPIGIEFKDGIISGSAKTTGRTTITLNATNCFGTSANASFDVLSQSSYNLIPFAIDVDNPSTAGASACLLPGTYELYYHNGKGSLPELNDTVFLDQKAIDKFVGGKLWYKIDNSLYSIQIDEFGTVIDTHTC